MELELQHQTLEGFRPVFDAILPVEETLESIVPDSLPDVARIVSATGTAFLKDKDVGEGTLRLTGTARITVLYIPEGEDAARAVDVSIPFLCTHDCPQLRDGCYIHGAALVASADARAINPRKLLVRTNLTLSVTVYGRERRELSCDVTGCKDDCIEKQFSQCQDHLISEVVEKPFTFSDMLRQPASRPAMDELLSSRTELGTIDAKLIGRKLVLKGEVLLSVLYRSGGSIHSAGFELPYSQIMDLAEPVEEGSPEITIALRSADCRLGDGELEVTVEALAQGTVWVRQAVTLISDVYCTACPIEAERTPCALCSVAEQGSRRELARQFCQSGIPGKQVLDCSAAVQSLTGSGMTYTAQVNVEILYLSEDDALCGANYTVPVSCEVPVTEGGRCRCRCRPVGEPSAVPVTGGLEVRFEAEFQWIMTCEQSVPCVNSVKHGAAQSADTVRPSVVIRMIGDGESLWDIAKSCGSTVKDICSANGLPSEAVPSGTLLLIPAKR